ncbi:hypothetical protein BKA70DRAFT_1044550, partial [Coprinopsis sp. MPI-PUGE-AT-0042]
WQGHRFRETDIPLHEVVSSIKKDLGVVEPRQLGDNKDYWALYATATGKVAIISHALVWSWATPLETGNFVPEGKELPPDVQPSRVQHEPGPKCGFSYAFDTKDDMSIYDGISAIESLAENNPTFNRYKKPKYMWQKPTDTNTNGRYIFSARVFSKRTSRNCSDDGRYHVHYRVPQWVANASAPHNNSWIPNEDRPRYLDCTGDKFKQILQCDPPSFEKGDIVWVSFIVNFTMEIKSWRASVVPLEFVRVGRI